jgi:heme-degrading monooxygenase HmoA
MFDIRHPMNICSDAYIHWTLTKEEPMTIQVIIRRTFEGEEKAQNLAPLIVQLRSEAMIQPGYISGATLRCIDCPGEYLVLSTWNTTDDWNRWLNSEKRKAIQGRIDALLGEQTEYRVYEPLVGGIIPRFNDGSI